MGSIKPSIFHPHAEEESNAKPIFVLSTYKHRSIDLSFPLLRYADKRKTPKTTLCTMYKRVIIIIQTRTIINVPNCRVKILTSSQNIIVSGFVELNCSFPDCFSLLFRVILQSHRNLAYPLTQLALDYHFSSSRNVTHSS